MVTPYLRVTRACSLHVGKSSTLDYMHTESHTQSAFEGSKRGKHIYPRLIKVYMYNIHTLYSQPFLATGLAFRRTCRQAVAHAGVHRIDTERIPIPVPQIRFNTVHQE